MDNGCDVPAKVLQAQIALISSQIAGPLDLCAQAVLCAVKHGANVQNLDASCPLEQGSASDGVGSAPRL